MAGRGEVWRSRSGESWPDQSWPVASRLGGHGGADSVQARLVLARHVAAVMSRRVLAGPGRIRRVTVRPGMAVAVWPVPARRVPASLGLPVLAGPVMARCGRACLVAAGPGGRGVACYGLAGLHRTGQGLAVMASQGAFVACRGLAGFGLAGQGGHRVARPVKAGLGTSRHVKAVTAGLVKVQAHLGAAWLGGSGQGGHGWVRSVQAGRGGPWFGPAWLVLAVMAGAAE